MHDHSGMFEQGPSHSLHHKYLWNLHILVSPYVLIAADSHFFSIPISLFCLLKEIYSWAKNLSWEGSSRDRWTNKGKSNNYFSTCHFYAGNYMNLAMFSTTTRKKKKEGERERNWLVFEDPKWTQTELLVICSILWTDSQCIFRSCWWISIFILHISFKKIMEL